MKHADIETLEAEVVQTAIEWHCRRDDTDLEDAHRKAVSALIEARYQSIRSEGTQP